MTPPEPDIPWQLDHLWQAFWSLNNDRSSNGFSLNPLSWLEFEAWQRGTGNVLTSDEEMVVKRLFAVFDQATEEDRPKPEETT